MSNGSAPKDTAMSGGGATGGATSDKVMLVCTTCHNKVMQDVRELSEKVIPGFHDNKYSFACRQCSSSKTPMLFHLGKSWKCVIHTALFNLERMTGNRFFHHSDVTSYVMKYPHVFLHDKSLADISKAVSMAFFNNKGYFVSGGPYTGKWANPKPSEVDSLEGDSVGADSPMDAISTYPSSSEHDKHDSKLERDHASSSNSHHHSRDRERTYIDVKERDKERVMSRSNSRGRSPSRTKHQSGGSSRSNSRSRSRSRSSSSNSDSGHNYRRSSSSRSSSRSNSDSESDSDEADYKSTVTCTGCKNDAVLEFNANRVLPGPFDKNYEYTCKYCTANGAEPILKHMPKSWTKIIHTALHNLELEKGIRFHSRKDIFQYVASHQKDLVSEPKQDVSLAIINYILSSGRSLFINSCINSRLWCNRKKRDKVEFDGRGVLVLSKELDKKQQLGITGDQQYSDDGGVGPSTHSHGGSSSVSSTHHSSSSGASSGGHYGQGSMAPGNGGASQGPAKLTPLYCNACKLVFVNGAAELLENKKSIIPSHIDTRYIYTCAKCNDKKVATLIHLPKSWKVIVHTTLYNLELGSGSKFSSNKALYSFISENASTLLLGGKTIDYLNKNLSGVLSSYKNLFCSSGRNMWGNVSQDDKKQVGGQSGAHHHSSSSSSSSGSGNNTSIVISSANSSSNNNNNYDDDHSDEESSKTTKRLKLTIPNVSHRESSTSSSSVSTAASNESHSHHHSSSSGSHHGGADDDLPTASLGKRKHSDAPSSSSGTSTSSTFTSSTSHTKKASSTSSPSSKAPKVSAVLDEDLLEDNMDVNIYDERIQNTVGFLTGLGLTTELGQLRREIEELEIPELKGLEFRFLLRRSPIALKQEAQYTVRDCLLNVSHTVSVGIRSVIPNASAASSTNIDVTSLSTNPFYIVFSQLLNQSLHSPTMMSPTTLGQKLLIEHNNNHSSSGSINHSQSASSMPPSVSISGGNGNNSKAEMSPTTFKAPLSLPDLATANTELLPLPQKDGQFLEKVINTPEMTGADQVPTMATSSHE
ncbi:hypothetical protein SAMD00019534_117100 [Acytostelium subglobosum LB1]|uniref:hypothetical protein n=1 Tax=Acytostelium subglobosum LB1 TaxID=1410327 RepID=UPI00064499F4|nr:hypothetical protein SAMD00019534_117100 [Acytostelium subglobosum LB1]GAM28534.1 hypothetical protein SAMD00019534_117100 [Acytostelium subglobosum LB1]|eukprot:XP_012748573.1 hypothetical protein SAMD00019534_117100 [Acytostelium subglobosum LB1]